MVQAKIADGLSKRALQIQLARLNFWEYCKLRLPNLYRDDRPWLKDMCDRMQNFWQHSNKQFLIINLPPRHFKSLTGQQFAEWIFGQSIENRVITCSYNERLATLFAKKVRNTIMTTPGQSKTIQFRDIFPGVNVSKKDAAADMWSLDGSPVPSYLATSPGGTATGVGCTSMIVDDLVKNSLEAYSDTIMDNLAEWFFDTMMSRLEGNNWKVICIMQRWSTKDLAGLLLDAFDCEHVDYPAYTLDNNGNKVFLCPDVLDEKSYREKTHKMSPHIADAVYLQKPVDIQGRLYRDFNEYKVNELKLSPEEYVYSVTDTADKGADSLVTIIYVEREGIAYVLDIYMSDSPMEITERAVAEMHDKWQVKIAFVEANNGGRGFARNVRRMMKQRDCVFLDEMQTGNKEARIITSAGWVQNYVWFPEGYKARWENFYTETMSYNSKAKNEHDDAVDALAYVYALCTRQTQIEQQDYDGFAEEIVHTEETMNHYGQSVYELDEEVTYW